MILLNKNTLFTKNRKNYPIKLNNNEKECYREVIERQKNKIKKYRLIR